MAKQGLKFVDDQHEVHDEHDEQRKGDRAGESQPDLFALFAHYVASRRLRRLRVGPRKML